MPKKKDTETQAISSEERFFLNLNEELTVDIEYENFMFTLEVPNLMVEATVSMGVLRTVQQLLRQPEYRELAESLTMPMVEEVEDEEDESEQASPRTQVIDKPINLDKLNHIRYALKYLPDDFINTVNNIAYLNIVVIDIAYNGKPVWVTADGDEIKIDTFEKFIKYVKTRNIRFGQLINKIISDYYSWLNAMEVSPQEVKN